MAAALSIDDLVTLKTLAVREMNAARKHAEAAAGEDFLRALDVDSFRAQPSLGETARHRIDVWRERAALVDRISVALDDALIADDPDGTKYPAAHARVREREQNAAVAS